MSAKLAVESVVQPRQSAGGGRGLQGAVNSLSYGPSPPGLHAEGAVAPSDSPAREVAAATSGGQVR